MRYTRAHKAQTRQRILREASRRLRAEGIARLSIDDLMLRLGLTHGGFYAHFASKDALVVEACAQELPIQEVEMLAEPAETSARDGVATFISGYLSRQHRDAPEMGCYLAALSGEMAHASLAARQTFSAAFECNVDQLAHRLPGATPQARTDAALALLTGMAGAVAASRAVTDEKLSKHILDVCRKYYTRVFAAGDDEGRESET